MKIKLLVEAGAMKPGPALSQKIGPTGVNINQVIKKVNEATKSFAGIKVPVEVDIDLETKDIEVKVSSPSASELLKKELGVEKGSGASSKIKIGDLSIEQIISIAKTKYPNLLARTLKAAVKAIVGTCVSLGVLIENKPAVEIQRAIDEGEYDNEISQEKTETSLEKKANLEKFFAELKDVQDKLQKQEEAAKAAVETKSTETTNTTAPAAKTPTKSPKSK